MLVHQPETPAQHVKSSFEQRLEAQRAEERRRIQLLQREKELKEEQERRRQQQQPELNGEQQRSASVTSKRLRDIT